MPGSSYPDIRVLDAGGVEIPDRPGIWIVAITQSILDKGNYVIVDLSDEIPGEPYEALPSFLIEEPTARDFPAIDIPRELGRSGQLRSTPEAVPIRWTA